MRTSIDSPANVQRRTVQVGHIHFRRILGAAVGLVAAATIGCSASDDKGPGRVTSPGTEAPGGGDDLLGGNDQLPGGDLAGPDLGGGQVATGTPGSGCPTTLSGTTYDPAGTLPLYNVVVYVPSEGLAPIVSGASCETCSGDFSGKPVAAAVSDATGAFKLDITKVASRSAIPLVIQAGKWRRQVTIPAATDCTDTPLPVDLTRLPRNRAEGSLPKVAVMRGGSDALECIFTKIGVDLAEFSTDAGDGRIQLYHSPLENGSSDIAPGIDEMSSPNGIVPIPNVDALFSDINKLKSYDMVLLSCEGGDERYGTPDLTHRENLHRYANEGGRLFGGHYHNSIIANNELPDDYPGYPNVVQFASGRGDITPETFPATVNTNFEKGKALADWLMAVGGSTTHGTISIRDSERTVLSTVDPTAVSWINTQFGGGNVALYYGFPTPVGGAACGRMVYTDVHLASGSGDSGKQTFPSCSTELTAQQKALAFLIFDLANCVETTETAPPRKPIIY